MRDTCRYGRAAWATCQPPAGSIEDLRGRAHDVLWTAASAVRSALRFGELAGRLRFGVCLGNRRHRMLIVYNPAEGLTIGYRVDF